MKNSVTAPTSYELSKQRAYVAETFDLFLQALLTFTRNTVRVIQHSSSLKKVIRVCELISVVNSTFYLLNMIAFTMNYFAVVLGGNPSLAMDTQYQLILAGSWLFPFTTYIAYLFLKKYLSL